MEVRVKIHHRCMNHWFTLIKRIFKCAKMDIDFPVILKNNTRKHLRFTLSVDYFRKFYAGATYANVVREACGHPEDADDCVYYCIGILLMHEVDWEGVLRNYRYQQEFSFDYKSHMIEKGLLPDRWMYHPLINVKATLNT